MKTFAASLAILLSTSTLATAAGFEVLKPHRAVYDVKLENAEERSGIKAMSGRIVYELKGNECDGISVRYRFVTNINTGRASFTTDQQTATYESPDGDQFMFDTKSFVNDQPDQKISGNATRENGEITVSLTGENAREMELGEGIFTTNHLVDIMRAAKDGTRFLVHDVFDGSGDADEILNSATVIGAPKIVGEVLEGEEGDALDKLKQNEAWPITMSYFNKNQDNTGESVPIYEASFLLYKDGITRQLMMKYPDYSLRASLNELEYFDSEACKIQN